MAGGILGRGALALLASVVFATPSVAAIAFVQVQSAVPQSPQSMVGATFTGAQTSGNLNVVVVGWSDTTSHVLSVTDSLGNTYSLAIGPTVQAGVATQSIYYSAGITGTTAGGNTVTVQFDAPANYVDLRIAEYSGVDVANPVDVVVAAMGNSGNTNSGAVTTTNANDLLVGASLVQGAHSGPGPGYTSRIITDPDSDILEDRIVTATGSYSATAPLYGPNYWIMQMVAFRGAGAGGGDTQAPTAPSGLTATAGSSSQINLSWTASTDSVGVTGYRIERCQGAGCSNFVQIATAASTSFSNTGLTGSTSYSYRVRATDAAVNLSGYSGTATAITQVAPDTQAPTAPSGLSATATSSTQINLSWTASTDDVSVTNYLIERCQGAGCNNFAQIATAAGTTFSNTGLIGATSYSYRVRATDAASNLSSYSGSATATTPAPPDTQAPTAPSGLTATATSSTQINLSWTASSDNVAVTNYLVERCQGAGCSNFGQIATASGTTFSNTGLTGSTSYSYRVRATDAASNLSGYSGSATATTQVPPDTQAPTAPSGLSATAASSTQINLSWTGSTDNVAVTNYLIERCQGAGCSNFAQIATASGTTFSNTALAGSTSYSYRVRATDAVNNLSSYSGTASATTQATPDTQAPTAPSGLAATATSNTQINLSWAAATDDVGVTSYLIERCQGAGCSSFAQIATASGTTFSNSGLTASTSYSYRVRATDAADNLSGYSGTATATTQAAPDTQAPTAPSGLSATATSSTQINLSWTASTDDVGVTNYLIERCQGAGCSNFAQIATSVGTTFSNTGLTGSTSYSYRVRATDAANNLGGYSGNATATTQVAPDTQAPTAPSGLSATATSSTQINLSWTASTDDVGVTNYLIERCQGAGCSNFAQIATSVGTTFSNTGLTGSTSYSYRVRATDAANNLSGYSGTATATTQAAPDTQAPTAPSGLGATAASSSQINLSWTAATDNVAVTGYRIERCQGTACTNFAQIATSVAATFSNTGLTASTTYRYQVRATDAAGNLSSYSGIAGAATQGASAAPIAYIQSNYAVPQNPQATVAVTYQALQTAGNLNVVVVGWSDTTSHVVSVTDTRGNAYELAAGPTVQTGVATQSIYYAAGIGGSAASSNVVTVVFDAPANYVDMRIAEYSGIDPVNPIDTGSEAMGNSGTTNSGAVTTSNANDLLVGANLVQSTTAGPGTGYTSRLITNPDGDILEDRVVAAIGSYSATAPLTGSSNWIMQMVAFRGVATGGGDTQAPTAPSALGAAAVSNNQINLSWTAATDNTAVTSYLVERCQGAGCSNFAQVGTSAVTTFSSTGLTLGTSYSFRVRAIDAANNASAYSNTATATTTAVVDTQAPTAPGGLTATTTSSTQINLSWTASTDDVGVTNYLIERCQGAGCSNFAQIATAAGTTFSNTGLAASTSYSYRVRATDAAGNLSAYSTAATAVTTANTPDTTPPVAAVTGPASGASVSGTVTLSANVTDNVSVSGVQFQVDGINVGQVDGTAPYSLAFNTAQLANGTHTVTAYAWDPSRNIATTSAVTVTFNNASPGNPAQTGMWSGLQPWPLVSIHLNLLTDGRVLAWDQFATGVPDPYIWDPVTSSFRVAPTNDAENLFCTGHINLADGRLFAAGGEVTIGAGNANSHIGLAMGHILNPATNQWSSTPNMAYGRWYPTLTTLADGRVLTLAGETNCFGCIAAVPEIYNPVSNSWTQLNEASLALPWYPFTFLMPDGRVIVTGAVERPTVTRVLDVAARTWTTIDSTNIDGGSSVMYLPGKFMKTGTSSNTESAVAPTSRNTYVLDMTVSSPAWRQTASMAFPRAYHTTTSLPDGSVLVTGGGRTTGFADLPNAVYQAELWNPATETFTTLASMNAPRLYHQTAILMPDARVLVSGSGRGFGRNDPSDQLSGELFAPPYLFKGPRPRITTAPSQVSYGQTISIQTPNASSIAKVALIRAGTMTHSVNMDQRYLPLTFTVNGGTVSATAPANANLAPPGQYMLFIIDNAGVPSVASMVRF